MRIELDDDGTRVAWLADGETREQAQALIDAGEADEACWFRVTRVTMRTVGSDEEPRVVFERKPEDAA